MAEPFVVRSTHQASDAASLRRDSATDDLEHVRYRGISALGVMAIDDARVCFRSMYDPYAPARPYMTLDTRLVGVKFGADELLDGTDGDTARFMRDMAATDGSSNIVSLDDKSSAAEWMSMTYEFNNTQLVNLVNKNLYSPAFKVPEVLYTHELDIPMHIDADVFYTRDFDSGARRIHSMYVGTPASTMTLDRSCGYDMDVLFEPAPLPDYMKSVPAPVYGEHALEDARDKAYAQEYDKQMETLQTTQPAVQAMRRGPHIVSVPSPVVVSNTVDPQTSSPAAPSVQSVVSSVPAPSATPAPKPTTVQMPTPAPASSSAAIQTPAPAPAAAMPTPSVSGVSGAPAPKPIDVPPAAPPAAAPVSNIPVSAFATSVPAPAPAASVRQASASAPASSNANSMNKRQQLINGVYNLIVHLAPEREALEGHDAVMKEVNRMVSTPDIDDVEMIEAAAEDMNDPEAQALARQMRQRYQLIQNRQAMAHQQGLGHEPVFDMHLPDTSGVSAGNSTSMQYD